MIVTYACLNFKIVNIYIVVMTYKCTDKCIKSKPKTRMPKNIIWVKKIDIYHK